MPFDILRLESPTHLIHTKRTHSKAVVTLADQSLRHLDKSFILLVGVEEAHTPRMWVEVDEHGDHASMVLLIPFSLLSFFFLLSPTGCAHLGGVGVHKMRSRPEKI